MDNTLLLFFLSSYGITAILIYAELTEPLRKVLFKVDFLKRLWTCAMCLGFWVGLLNYFIFFDYHPVNHFWLAFASSGVTWLLCAVTQFALWGKVFFEMKYNHTVDMNAKVDKSELAAMLKDRRIDLNE